MWALAGLIPRPCRTVLRFDRMSLRDGRMPLRLCRMIPRFAGMILRDGRMTLRLCRMVLSFAGMILHDGRMSLRLCRRVPRFAGIILRERMGILHGGKERPLCGNLHPAVFGCVPRSAPAAGPGSHSAPSEVVERAGGDEQFVKEGLQRKRRHSDEAVGVTGE